MRNQPPFPVMAAAILRQTGRNLARTWSVQIMTLLTVALAVLLFAFFLLLHLNLQAAGSRLGEDLRLTAYLEQETNPTLQPRLEEQIRQFGAIDEVRFISRAQALERFSRRLGEEREILVDLEPDFLPPAIEVVPSPGRLELEELEQLAAFLATLPDVSRVQYGQQWRQRFHDFNRLLRLVVVASATLLVLSLVFTVSRTIRLTLAARREELDILQLLGADRAFTGAPFLAEGLLQGAAGSLLGLGALYLLYQRAAGLLAGEGVLSLFTPSFIPPAMLWLIVAASALLCLASSLVAINKSLRS